ncbi:hypothetical protein EN943_15650 [Mesorhizobium sp. M7A.F.Ca.US.006.01.1.1]|uniref:hypothetical protein n=1 Tax=Mesorhizobium sp. M7A.F.Ca.US.006.01.1.1 TaxID=2496707 RepID=UPI000FCCACE2|nr:hypothetical protein [Mesorhizobium sp. M7A.F.Ca.US.006.01.1.1]RUZ76914.1 hypothetical protein EN943_15650 [Mesorhizobium sp. M7A.F.Ca.US.006.01.1.1]
MFAYSNNGYSFRAVDDDYQAAGDEVLFGDYATPVQLAEAFSEYGSVVERAKVPKSTVMQRLIDINKMDQAYFMLSSQPKFFARWFAPDHPSVFCDDPDAVAFVTALALDPAVILASETAA